MKNIYATVGIHPHDVSKTDQNTLDTLKELVKTRKKIVAYGEIGWIFFATFLLRKNNWNYLECNWNWLRNLIFLLYS